MATSALICSLSGTGLFSTAFQTPPSLNRVMFTAQSRRVQGLEPKEEMLLLFI